MNYTEGLEQLKQKSNNNEVSALIGAGFSKNVYANYPSWDELLFDMVTQLYNPEIETGFNNAMHYNPTMKIDFREYSKKKVQEIIAREGYLDIVSKYINKKGYREAIETYIEERIPSIDESTPSLTFGNNSKTIPLNASNFDSHIKLLEGPWDNIYTTNYDGLLEFTAKKFGKTWNVIKAAQDLSFSKQAKSIIKLHGNLCTDNKAPFEFDGNHHHRYIISKEDYESYPIQHQAFTQLMRISLLQGTFCLIGFSGTDPNFIAWIKWVRDILVPNKRQEEDKSPKEEDYKIFLIDITDSEPPPDKQLFYNNHNIFHIPLLNDEIKGIIGVPNSKEPKQLIISFLSYLYDKKTYDQLWTRVYSSKIQSSASIDEVILKQICKTKRSNRIVKSVLWQNIVLSDLCENKEFSKQELQLLLLALEDTFYLLDFYPNLAEAIGKQTLPEEQNTLLDVFKERSITLNNPFSNITATDKDCYMYEQVLRKAFRLDFAALKEVLTKWEPQGTYIPKKALFLSLFDCEKAKNILLNYIDTEIEVNERYFATQLLNLIDWYYPPKYSTVKYENQNMDGFYELKDKFIKATEEKEDLPPYGGEDTFMPKSNADYRKSLRALQFLIEFPIFLSIGNYVEVINPKDWYQVFRNIFQKYPFPALFYSIQCTSKDVLKRIGQEYAYSDILEKEVPGILGCMLSALVYLVDKDKDEDAPTFLESNLFEISKELFVSVKPPKWENSFLTIWEKKVCPFYGEIVSGSSIYRFVCAALQYVSSKNCITRILVDCLEKEKQNKNNTINFLDYLPVSKKQVLLDESLQKKINQFVSKIDSDEEIAIAGNLYPLLSPENINAIATKIKEIIQGESVSKVAFRAATYFSKISKKNIQQVKQALISNKKLWDNGILEAGIQLPLINDISYNVSSPPDFIQLSSLKENIKWNNDELCIIYRKLKVSFNQVINDKKTEGSLPFIYDTLFDEMLRFITDYQKELSAESDFSEIHTKLTTELGKLRGYININEALISDDSDKIVHGLNQLYDNIITSKIEDHEGSINLLIDRILFKRKEELKCCIDYIAHYLSRYYTKENLSMAMVEKLQLILKIYTKETFQELDMEVPSNVKHLIQISDSLRKMRYGSESTEYWLSVKRSKRFNNF